MDVDLAQPPVARVDERMRLVGRHDHRLAGTHDALLAAVAEPRLAFDDEEQLCVRVLVQAGPSPRRRVDDDDRRRNAAVVVADELVADLGLRAVARAHEADAHCASLRYSWTNAIAMLPSPTAAAT